MYIVAFGLLVLSFNFGFVEKRRWFYANHCIFSTLMMVGIIRLVMLHPEIARRNLSGAEWE